MTYHDLVTYFVISFSLTLIFSWLGDDDVVYDFINRKPSLDEAIKRGRFVFAKFFASLYGGGVIALFLAQHVLREIFLFDIAKDQFILFIWWCVALFSFVIGGIQNLIRLVRGRKTRPLLDIAIWKNARDRWRHRV